MVCGAALVLGCGPPVGTPEMADSASSSSSGAQTSSSTGEPGFDGPGCGPPPTCNRGRFEGHARVQSSADLEALAGYTEVSGMLEISGSEDLVCLDALACLETVGRDLRVQDNAALRSTAGLHNLRMLGTAYEEPNIGRPAMFIGNNAVLEVFDGSALEGYVNHLVIWDNPSLVDVADLRFEQLDALSVIVGFHIGRVERAVHE